MDVGESLSRILGILMPMTAEERQRTLAAVTAFFGDPVPSGSPVKKGGASDIHTDIEHISQKSQTWMRQNNLELNEIEKVFHISGGSCEVIASVIPGKSKKEQTFNAYVLLGLSQMLTSGSPTFDDKAARNLCIQHGCYDAPNHASNFKEKGNDLAGSKEKGWTVTAPGLKNGAVLVKELAQSN